MARARPSSPPDPLDRLLGEAPPIQGLRTQIRHLARFDAVGHPVVPTVLLQGETGTGKGLVARVIHDSGPRAQGPFIEVNCAAIPETLLEAELFGVEAGAFTDAKRAKPGLFETAAGGTLFLDEIEALPLPLQGKCLTAIETKRVRRVGAVVEHPMDVKLIAATPVALHERVAAGHFRADLYHRLAVVVLELPPLRLRGDDILMLARALLQQYGAAYGVGPRRLSTAAEEWLVGQPWPGNVRELSHLLERVALLETATVIDPESLARLCLPQQVPEASPVSRPASTPGVPLHERERVAEAVRQTGGNLAAAARLLGMSRTGLRHRMHTYGLTRPSWHQVVHRVRQETAARDMLPSSAADPTVSPAREKEPPMLPSSQQGEDQGAVGSARGEERLMGWTRRAALEPSRGWVPKPTAVLAIEATWPDMSEAEDRPYEPWTGASRWSETIAEKVSGFGGIMLQESPTLCVVGFGLPQTLEQLPQRVVQAALAIRHLAAEAHTFTREMPGPAVRLAAHLGTLLVAEATGESPWRWLAVGETLALPVWLLGHAVAGEILVSSAVGRFVEGWCACQPHAGPPGIDTLLVIGLTPRPSPLRLRGERPLSRFVGRERELATLTDLLAQATEGRGQVVGIVGEPGIGKSRLLYEFHQYLRAQSVPSVEGQCLSYGQAIPFGPVLSLLRQHSGITQADTPEAVTAKVWLILHTAGIDPDEAAPYVFQLLGLQAGIDRLADLSPEIRKTRTFETLRQIYLANSQQHPFVLAVENLHWIDPTSEAFLASLIESLAGARLFVLFTYRPGYRPPWIDKSYATQMVLPPLSAADSQRLLGSVLPTATITATLAQQILTKAQGNPFFLEEIAQTLVDQGELRHESGMTLPPALQLPATVQEVLGARIDQLPPEEKRLLQAAAVIGKDVPFAVLQAITELSEEALHRGLAPLQAAEFLYETCFFPVREYTFKHALTQDVAYGSLHQERRRTLHARIVEVLEALYADRLGEQVERLAHHALRGEVWAKAVTYCQQAGARARDRAAFHEAVAYMEQALQALDHLPEPGDTRVLALELRLTLGGSLRALGENGRCLALFSEAEALARALDDRARLGRVLAGMAIVLRQTGDHDGAIAAGRQALELAVALGDSALQVRASYSLGQAYSAVGDFGRAAELLRRNVEAADRESGTPDIDSRIQFQSQLAWTLSALGAFAEGRRHGEEAFRLATLAGRGDTQQTAHNRLGNVHLAQGDLEHAIRVWEQGLVLCHASDRRASLRGIVAGLGYAYALQGRLAEGRALMEEGISESLRAGARQAVHWAWLSEVCRLAGCGEEAWQHARQALELARQQKTRGDEACVLHQLGTLHARSDPPDAPQAEAQYWQALALAEELGMRPLQAHCDRSLGTLYAAMGRHAEARAELDTAIALYRAMEMTFWMPEAEAALARVEGRP